MKKNILIYGLIAGTLVSVFMIFTVNNMSHCEGSIDFDSSLLIGYASMLLSFSLVFVGVRNYRDKYNGGVISFGKAFRVAMGMVLVASTVYAFAWLVDYTFFVPDFMEKYAAHTLDELKSAGAGAAEIEAKTKEMADLAVLYKNPLVTLVFTYLEILPVGLIVALISSFILKRKSVQVN